MAWRCWKLVLEEYAGGDGDEVLDVVVDGEWVDDDVDQEEH